MEANEGAYDRRSRWRWFTTLLALLLALASLLVAIQSYRNSNTIRYSIGIEPSNNGRATLTKLKTGLLASKTYDFVVGPMDLSSVFVSLEVRITNTGLRPFSIERLNGTISMVQGIYGAQLWVSKQGEMELSEDNFLSSDLDRADLFAVPAPFNKPYESLTDGVGRPLATPFLVEPGDQQVVLLGLQIPIVDAVAKRIFGRKATREVTLFNICEQMDSYIRQSNSDSPGSLIQKWPCVTVLVRIAQRSSLERRRMALC